MLISRQGSKSTQAQENSRVQVKPTSVVLSGFGSGERGQLIHFLQSVPNLIVEEDMTFRVKIVISNTVSTNKYKAAATLGIPVVKMQWAIDSYKQKTMISTDDYLLGIFTGMRIGLLGFNQMQYDEINSKVIDQDGQCTQNIMDLQILNEIPTVLVVQQEAFTQYQSLIEQLGHTACDIEWLRQCWIRQCFVPVQHYNIQKVISGENIDKDSLYEQLLQSALDKAFDEQGLDEFTYFQGVVAFINFKEEKVLQLIQKYISIGDGTFVSEKLPMVTHIITLDVRQDFQKTGAIIVNPLWVRDSFSYRTKLVENDYKVYEKQQINRILFQQDDTPAPKLSSQDQFGLSRGTPFQPNIQLMNQVDLPKRSFSTKQFSTTQNKSNLFKGLVFFIYDDPMIERKLRYLIRENGGAVESFRKNLPPFENKKDSKISLVVLPDSKETPELAQRLGFSRFISPRWVTYCIEKRIVELSIQEKKLLTLLPTQFETPLEDIKGMQIYVSVKSLDDKVLFKDMVYILTGQLQKQFQVQGLSYLVSDKVKSKKHDLVSLSIIKSPKWLIQLFQTGKLY